MRIGIFDSGIGGLNVLQELINKYPHNHYIYYGDTKHVPYGDKSFEELRELSTHIMDFLKAKKVDLIIIACGTISSNCYQFLKEKYNLPLYDIITPTINYVNSSDYMKIGVIGTTKTIESGIFVKKINKTVLSHATPLLVPMIESNNINNKIIAKSIEPLKKNIDVLILGCTHYPCLANEISNYLNVPLIDMGKCLVEELSLTNEDDYQVDLYFSKLNETIKDNISHLLKDKYQLFED